MTAHSKSPFKISMMAKNTPACGFFQEIKISPNDFLHRICLLIFLFGELPKSYVFEKKTDTGSQITCVQS